MFFKKKKPWVRFVSGLPGVETAHPIIKAQGYSYDWFRSAAADYKNRQEIFEKCPIGNLHSPSRCPGLHQLFKTGFIITNPIDFTITTTRGELNVFRWACSTYANYDGREYIGFHSNDQLSDFMPMREDSLNSIIKVHTHWKVYSSSDIVFLQIPIPYPDHNMFSAVHGIVDPILAFEINTQLFWHKLDGTHLVKAGTPLAQWIPIPRDLAVELTVSKMTEEDRYNSLSYNYFTKMNFHKDIKSFLSSCRKVFWKN